jgi:DNA-binding FrmR family transcriptional regulator
VKSVSRERIREIMAGNTLKKTCGEERDCCLCHQKSTPRDEKELKQLKNRLSRMSGQLNGIGKMLDENRYCGDILTQVAAVESALQAFGYLILQEHMETCVVEEIKKGNTAVVEEAVELVKKLK